LDIVIGRGLNGVVLTRRFEVDYLLRTGCACSVR
jgi:hypothetical protein